MWVKGRFLEIGGGPVKFLHCLFSSRLLSLFAGLLFLSPSSLSGKTTELQEEGDSPGDIAHVWVLYEAEIPGWGRPAQPGVDSFQLVRRDGG